MTSDPIEAAQADARAALHLPGAARGWNPRTPVQLPPADADRRAWLSRYAAALAAAAGPAPAPPGVPPC